ncbi:AAEL004706-PA [Aedes aegypti]|uniref:AAEL004706-PA n=1 Tax=Aedes aegypti TaxID=7159 RepID=Q0IFL1_AEDAE|nr:AAEL004706-PA [Aedes aegypti]
MYLVFSSCRNFADRLASKNNPLTSTISSLVICVRPLTLQFWCAGVSSWTAYRRVVLSPISLNAWMAESSTLNPSVCALSLMICSISDRLYGAVRTISKRSNKSNGIPWGEIMSSVPRITQRPLLVAKMTIGAIADSNDLCK